MLRNFKFINILFILFMVLMSLLLFRPKDSALRLTASVPADKAAQTDPDLPITYHFSLLVDPKAPYDSFSITPKVDGTLAAKDDELVFTPTTGFDESTDYSVTIATVRSVNGKTIGVIHRTFTTAARKKTAFESTLPYDGGDFTVERLSDGTFLVNIINPPAKQVRVWAMDFLANNKVDPKKVTVHVATSAE